MFSLAHTHIHNTCTHAHAHTHTHTHTHAHAHTHTHTHQIEDADEAVEVLEDITEEEEDIGTLEVTITTTLLEMLEEDVTQTQDRNVSPSLNSITREY